MRALAIVSIAVALPFLSESAQAKKFLAQHRYEATEYYKGRFSVAPAQPPQQFGQFIPNRDETNPFTIHWPSQSYPCSTIPQFCPGYHGSNGR
jgi:hypothetical protein